MTFWIIEPRDPLIVRDGRPFGPNPGARAATLPFPFPSTVVGGLRHKAGLDEHGYFDQSSIGKILTYGMRGPLLVSLNKNDAIDDWLLPAPADALVLDLEESHTKQVRSIQTSRRLQERAVRLQCLRPHETNIATNLPDGLQLVGPRAPLPNKVSGRAPSFWRQRSFLRWLIYPRDATVQRLQQLGIGRLDTNTRTHVSVQPDQQTAREGALFQTSGLDFTWRDKAAAKHHRFIAKRLALAAWFDGATTGFDGGLAPLGGERRLMHWSQGVADQALFNDQQKQTIYTQVVKNRQCRVLLLTPGYFTKGYRPPTTWVRGGVAATLTAACVPRMQTLSGWDLAASSGRGAPKPTRRLAPAGSVYFVTFDEGADVQAWLEATWMQNVSDDLTSSITPFQPGQMCLDGYGLAVIGTWPREEETAHGA